eukprot:TRINITY_DN4554_c0_g2_i1.p1 TRINITY_DN4554_c0_g2~~TRINITY_DN4554_c0_g2_i1.p1  ORF type:complete len:480 (+),score=75.34 TRINITY_DN4554_c0_g2_i1:72-1511(+)
MPGFIDRLLRRKKGKEAKAPPSEAPAKKETDTGTIHAGSPRAAKEEKPIPKEKIKVKVAVFDSGGSADHPAPSQTSPKRKVALPQVSQMSQPAVKNQGPTKIRVAVPSELTKSLHMDEPSPPKEAPNNESISKSVRIEEPLREPQSNNLSSPGCDTTFHIASPNGLSEPIKYNELQIGRRLGKGAEGVVSEAVHQPSGIELALKVTNFGAHFTLSDFESEVAKLQKIATDETLQNCAVQMYEVFHLVSARKAAFLMECMPHGSLTDCLKKLAGTAYTAGLPPATVAQQDGESTVITPPPAVTRYSVKDVSYVAYKGLTALAALQRLRFIHCDIKPCNMLVSGNDIKLADFGVARGTDTLSVAATGTGSIGYMPPERILGDEYSYNADVYSLGMMLGYCALGTYPLKGKTEFDTIEAVSMGTAQVRYPPEPLFHQLQAFTDSCLIADRLERPCAEQLLQHEFITSCPQEGPSFTDYLKMS